MKIKNKAITLITSALLATVALTTTTKSVKASDDNSNKVVKINYVPGYSIAVWNTANSNRSTTGQLLKHNTAWKLIDRTNGSDGYVWYSLGKNQWISSQYTNKPLKVANNGKTDVVRINYVPGYSIAVWNTANSNRSTTGQLLKHNTAWKLIDRTNGSDGYVWYSLGKNQWISSQYTNKPLKVANNGKTDVVRINYVPGYSIAVWNTANSNRSTTGQLLKHNTAWKIIDRTNGSDGYVWYSLGKNQWISSQYTNVPLKVNSGTNSNTNSNTNSGTNSNTNSGTNSNTNSGTNGNTNSGTNSNTKPDTPKAEEFNKSLVESLVMDKINALRTSMPAYGVHYGKGNLPAYKSDTELQNLADMRANEIIASNKYEHVRPNGQSMGKIDTYIDLLPGLASNGRNSITGASENLAFSPSGMTNEESSKIIFDVWANTNDGHRENLISDTDYNAYGAVSVKLLNNGTFLVVFEEVALD